MTLTIGRRVRREVADLAEASRVYQALRDESGEGYSTFPNGRVGKHTISYNGRVWLGHNERKMIQGTLVMEASRG